MAWDVWRVQNERITSLFRLLESEVPGFLPGVAEAMAGGKGGWGLCGCWNRRVAAWCCLEIWNKSIEFSSYILYIYSEGRGIFGSLIYILYIFWVVGGRVYFLLPLCRSQESNSCLRPWQQTLLKFEPPQVVPKQQHLSCFISVFF